MHYKNISNRDKQCGDRFIPRRASLDIQVAHYKITAINTKVYEQPTDILSQIPEYSYRQIYLKLLWSTIYQKETRLLSFSDFEQKDTLSNQGIGGYSSWPAWPRKRPLIRKPEAILDLPQFNSNLCMNVMDWGRSGYISTVFGRTVYLWFDMQNSVDEIINTGIHASKALKWDNSGSRLAVAGKSSISLWLLPAKKQVAKTTCPCLPLNCTMTPCHTTVLCWDHQDRHLVSGCSAGFMTVWSPSLVHIRVRMVHSGTVTTLQLSAANRYICSSGTDCRVRVWNWPEITELFQITYLCPVRAIAFHPWQDTLLAVGGTQISIWNVSVPKQVDCVVSKKESFIDCLTWNPITGELVSSHELLSSGIERGTSKVLVLASKNKVVDTIQEHTGRVMYLLWSPDFTQLATGGSDESLCIWNFFGKDSKLYSKKLTHYKNIERSKSMFQLGKCIR